MGLFQVMRESVIGGLGRVRVTAKDNKWTYIFSMISHEKNCRHICDYSFINVKVMGDFNLEGSFLWRYLQPSELKFFSAHDC